MSAGVTQPVTGQTDTCRVCGMDITFEGRFWTHVGPLQPRHKPIPLSVSGGGEMSALQDIDGAEGGG